MGKKSDLSVRIRKELRIKPNKGCILAVYKYGTLLGLITFLIAVFIQDVYKTIPIRKDTPTLYKPVIVAIYIPLRLFRLILLSAVKVRHSVISLTKLPEKALKFSIPLLDKIYYYYFPYEENVSTPYAENPMDTITEEFKEEFLVVEEEKVSEKADSFAEDIQPEVIVQIINRTVQDTYDPQMLTEIKNKLYKISSQIDLTYENQEKIKEEFKEVKNLLKNIKTEDNNLFNTSDITNEAKNYINDNLCKVIDNFISNYFIQPKIGLKYKRYGTPLVNPIIAERDIETFEFQLEYPNYVDSILFKNITESNTMPKSITVSFLSYGRSMVDEVVEFNPSSEQKLKLKKPVLCDTIKILVNQYAGENSLTIIPYFEVYSTKTSNYSA